MQKQMTLSVDELAKQANEAASASQTYAVNSISKAIEAGRALNQAKEQLPHGSWGAWLEANFDYDPTWGRRMMKLATNEAAVLSDGIDTIEQAVKLLGTRKAKRESTPVLDSPQETDTSPSQPVDSPPAEEYECPFETPPDDDEPPSEAHEPAAGEEYEDDDGPEVSADPLKDKKLARSRLIKTIQAAVRAVDDYHEICRSPKRRDEIVQLLQDSERLVWAVK